MKKSLNAKSKRMTSNLTNTLLVTMLTISLAACSSNEEYMSEELETEETALPTEKIKEDNASEAEAKGEMDGDSPDSLDASTEEELSKKDNDSPDELEETQTSEIPKTEDATQVSGSDYVVKEGDTLSLIANSQLGDSSRWQEIATLNSLENPNVISVGQTLKLPEGAPVKKEASLPETSAPSEDETSDNEPAESPEASDDTEI